MAAVEAKPDASFHSEGDGRGAVVPRPWRKEFHHACKGARPCAEVITHSALQAVISAPARWPPEFALIMKTPVPGTVRVA